MKLVVEFMLDLVSGANVRHGVRSYIQRVKRHRETTYWSLIGESRRTGLVPKLPCTVVFTRYGTRLLDAEENLPMAFKHIKDAVACKGTVLRRVLKPGEKPRTRPVGFIAVDDSDPRITWRYKQEQVKRALLGPANGQSRVKIEIEWSEA